MEFQFIRTANVYPNSPFRSLTLTTIDFAELIGNASTRAFVNSVNLCLGIAADEQSLRICCDQLEAR